MAAKYQKSYGALLQLVEKRGGQCLTQLEEYGGINASVKLRCGKDGWEWTAPLSRLRRGMWCPKCAGNVKKSFADLVWVSLAKGMICLSDSSAYVNQNSRLRVRCVKCKFEWEKSVVKLVNTDQGCPKCALRYASHLAFVSVVKAIRDRGGTPLFEEKDWNGKQGKLPVRCGDCGREWLVCPEDIHKGKWCPNCKGSQHEKQCREILEEILGAPFGKVSPAFLKQRSGPGLELDGYNEELQLAFEYQGEQHYHLIPHFHRGGEADLIAIKARDAKKYHLCGENWVTIIVIPYSEKDMRAFIAKELFLLGYTSE